MGGFDHTQPLQLSQLFRESHHHVMADIQQAECAARQKTMEGVGISGFLMVDLCPPSVLTIEDDNAASPQIWIKSCGPLLGLLLGEGSQTKGAVLSSVHFYLYAIMAIFLHHDPQLK